MIQLHRWIFSHHYWHLHNIVWQWHEGCAWESNHPFLTNLLGWTSQCVQHLNKICYVTIELVLNNIHLWTFFFISTGDNGQWLYIDNWDTWLAYSIYIQNWHTMCTYSGSYVQNSHAVDLYFGLIVQSHQIKYEIWILFITIYKQYINKSV